jgi:hypothetical protein
MAKRKKRKKPTFRSKEAKRKYEAYKHIHICKGAKKRKKRK